MTLRKDAKKSPKKSAKRSEEAAKAQAKQSKSESESHGGLTRGNSRRRSMCVAADRCCDEEPAQEKLERRASLRRKFGALIKTGAELPAAINRSLQPIRRSLSFSKDLNRGHEPLKPYRTTSVQWYNSLGSLAEDEDHSTNQETPRDPTSHVDPYSGKQIYRTYSLVEKDVTGSRRRANTLAGKPPLCQRHSDCYDSSIDLSNPPCAASSLPALTRATIDENDNLPSLHYGKEQQVRNGWGNVRASARNFSLLRHHFAKHSVRSRSLTQLDALGSSMLDTGEHHLGGGHSQQPQHQPHPLQHHASSSDSSPRFLVPNAPPTESTLPNRTRHKLSRSQVSSSEYFSVSFEAGDDAASFDREEFLPALKGTFLSEALKTVCERRGVDLSRVDVLLDSFTTPLSILTTETSCLGGKHLKVTLKDDRSNSRSASQKGSHNVSLRSTSGSYRNRNGRLFSVSTEDSSVDSEAGIATALNSSRSSGGTAALKGSKQRWSSFFTTAKGVKMEQLMAQLDDYTKHGVPKSTDITDLSINEDILYVLENDWRDIVESSEHLPEKQQQQQTALWELAQTELAYIRTLKVVTDLFMACLCSLQASNILSEVDRTKLFSNIPDIYAANRYFWTEHVMAMLNASRSTGKPLDSGHLFRGFETFEQTFAPYTRYCAEQSKCQQYCRDRLNDNELFTAYLVWCETQKDCNRLRLLDILVKPMQRLTKYSLLLKAVQKNTENDEQRDELSHMIKSVDDFVASVNAALRRNEEIARLASAASRLDSYDVVDTRDEELERLVKIYSTLDIVTAPVPGCPKDTLRILLREGDFKFKDAATSKMDVHVLLMTDMLLICKTSTKKASSSTAAGGTGSGLKIIRQPYVIDRIRVHELKEATSIGLIYLNEYGAASAALVLSAGDANLAKSWMESLRKAQQQFALMKVPPLGNTLSLAPVSRQPSTYLGDSEFPLDECEGIPRTSRGSSRASRVSSLAHSHSSTFKSSSGSMEMEGVSPGSSSFLPSYNPSRNISVENNEPPRASSVSSEEGTEVGLGHSRPSQARRSLLNKPPTPNTLSVQPPFSSLGQSLPNLTLTTSPQSSTSQQAPTPPNSLLIVPQITKSRDALLLSPGHRGTSYPPPSPPRGALRRAFALPQSRNPPLVKTRHVNASVVQGGQTTMSLDTETLDERRKKLERRKDVVD
ncbi:pleckstrin homology domain-containing family G member 5-like isoform X2 [Prorops nasuta]|uniref:pleckstrin homology domain-containing family G member 5-like isoform X2 n=1 Tax=Prorops nasuta TaxID=863751 RepID=UPI0034CD918F